MSKYRGSNFEDYLKEKGISEEVSTRAKKRWEVFTRRGIRRARRYDRVRKRST